MFFIPSYPKSNYLGIEYLITLDDLIFSSEKEIYMFGLVLHHFLLRHIEVNNFLNTKIKGIHKSHSYQWESAKGAVARC